MFGNKAKGLTIVYKYGCKAPAETDLAVSLDELFLRSRLWNKLVEIERTFRLQRDPLVVSDLDKELETLHGELSELSQTLRTAKAEAAYNTILTGQEVQQLKDTFHRIQVLLKTHTLTEPASKKKYRAIPTLVFTTLEDLCSTEELKQAITSLRENLRPLYTLAKAERKRLFELNKNRIGELEAERALAVKQARQNSGLYWGNYNDVIASYEAARGESLKTWSQLHFKSYDSSGKLTVQFIQPLRPEQVFGSNGQLQLDPVPPSAWDQTRGHIRKKDQWTKLRIRVRSTDKKKPVWLELPVCIHRPLPVNATIQQASVSRKKVGIDWRYSLLITLRLPEPAVIQSKRPTTVVRFHSILTNERHLQVASVERAGKTKTLVIPETTTSQFEKVDDLRSIADTYKVAAQNTIRTLREGKRIPDWFKERTQYTHVWRETKPYLLLLKDWKNQRFTGDEQAFKALDTFRERYYHLYPWEANLRDQIIERRKDLYRNFAAELVKTSGSIVLESLKETKPKKAETETQEQRNKRYWRRVAALYDLQTIIKNTARREGVIVTTLEDTELQAVA